MPEAVWRTAASLRDPSLQIVEIKTATDIMPTFAPLESLIWMMPLVASHSSKWLFRKYLSRLTCPSSAFRWIGIRDASIAGDAFNMECEFDPGELDEELR